MKVCYLTPGGFVHQMKVFAFSKHQIYLVTPYPFIKAKLKFGLETSNYYFCKTYLFIVYATLLRFSSNKTINKFTSIVFNRLKKTIATNAIDVAVKNRVHVLVFQSSLFGAIIQSGLKLNVVFVCDKPSADVRYENDIAELEYKSRGFSKRLYNANYIESEVLEYTKSDYIIAASNFSAKTLVNYGVAKSKIRVVPMSGYDANVFYPDGLPDTDPYNILFVGRVCFEKGVAYLLSAFDGLRISGKRLTIAGILFDSSTLTWIRENGFFDRADIEFIEHVNQNQLRKLMSTSHILVMPSLFDGYGYVVCEALACGCPAIVTKTTGASEIIEAMKNGYVINECSDSEIKSCLEDFYPKRNDVCHRKNVAMSVEKYKNWVNYAAQFDATIDEIGCLANFESRH